MANGSVWSLSDGRRLGGVPDGGKASLTASADGRRFLFRDPGNEFLLEFDTSRGSLTRLPVAASDSSGQFSADGSYFLHLRGGDFTVYATDGWKPLATYKAEAHGFKKMAGDLRPDGLAVLVRNDEEHKASALLWDWKSGLETPLLEGAWHATLGSWSPDSRIVLVTDWNAGPAFDAATGKRLFRYLPRPFQNGEGVRGVTFTPDSRRVVCVTSRIALTETGESNPLCIFAPPEGEAFSGVIAVSPDGRLLAAQSKSTGPPGASGIRLRRRRSASTACRSRRPHPHPHPHPHEPCGGTGEGVSGTHRGSSGKRGANGASFRFAETDRSPGYVQLLDASRGVTVRLYNDRQEDRHGEGAFYKVHDGEWVAE